ncbi:hypothetical protein LCGC14_0231510 [marine sediment metagenome]|uniref:ARG and Rhodanese-Phosphatase-superfamily-associated domain-containing protein n=1 Tax=marine sediment metagenome TaxID=412755 RepID=A0A0F9XE39_9ZZZZ
MTRNISEMLRGCTPGRMQTVGIMQVIPLLSDLEDDRFVSPEGATVHNSTYGNLNIDARSPDEEILVPPQTAYLVRERAQDHALRKGGFVKGRRVFDNALCVQETQGGTIPRGEHKFSLLPWSLREAALTNANPDFSAIWGNIRNFKTEAGLSGPGDLIDFMDKFQKELDLFVAEFERVPKQVGALIIIGGRLVGIERSPSRRYFREIWEALIRECYGSEAVRQIKLGIGKEPQRRPLPKVDNLGGLGDALESVSKAEREDTKNIIIGLLDDEFTEKREEASTTFPDVVLITIKNDQFVGQIVVDGARVHYISLVTTHTWFKDGVWMQAPSFKM